MSKSAYGYNHKSSKKRRKIKATEEMLKLVYTTRIETNEEFDTIYIYNGSERPIQAPITDDVNALAKVLEPKIMDVFRVTQEVAVKWIGLLSDKILDLLNGSDSDDEEDRKVCYVNKYTKGTRLLESIVINDQPCFIQLKEGSKTDFNLLSEFSTNSRVIKPYDVEQQGYPYVFESEDEIKYYLKLACKLTPNLNLDSIFKLLKTEFKQYVVLDDHHITLLVADTIWSLFQDKFSTTHYVFCLGDNSSGKNAILLTYYSFGYRVFMAGSVSGPNVLSALGNVESGQITLAEDEVDNLDNEHDKMTIWKMGYCQTGSRVPT